MKTARKILAQNAARRRPNTCASDETLFDELQCEMNTAAPIYLPLLLSHIEYSGDGAKVDEISVKNNLQHVAFKKAL